MSDGSVSYGLSGLPGRLHGAAKAVLPAISAAARRTGADFATLLNTAKVESSFNPDAKARTSSATGLFQFIDSTWLSALSRHGAKHGLQPSSRQEALALRRDAHAASLIAGEHMMENKARLEQGLKRAVGAVDLYFAHFLGAGGAVRFLGAMDKDGSASAASLMPAAAKANKAIFYDGGKPRSLQDVYSLIARRIGIESGQPKGEALPASQLASVEPTIDAAKNVERGAGFPGFGTGEQSAQALRVAALSLALSAFSPPEKEVSDLAGLDLLFSRDGGFSLQDIFSRSASSGALQAEDVAQLARLLRARLGV